MHYRVSRVIQLSRNWFLNRKFFVDCCISSGMLVLGDIIQQSYEIFVKRQSEFHRHRIFKMGYAGFATGAYAHHLYAYLDRRFPGRDVRSLTRKVILDNLSAPLQFVLFFGILAFVERKRLQEFLEELYSKGVHLYVTSSFIYAPAQYINFYFLSPQYRVLFVSILNLVFDTYSSYVAHDNERHEAFEDTLPDKCHL
ncbi:mpv17-like protein 2 [Paramacrobiotus metropolitanus]|uniref:mpv17-like protein 2 n=1 Tax=Paramacrobiotus metropolitanus TaxID=2943436 RepID=UPI00244584F3|nr:mpv17-like protein 2 [Paramacrobiotus metropolitanus]